MGQIACLHVFKWLYISINKEQPRIPQMKAWLGVLLLLAWSLRWEEHLYFFPLFSSAESDMHLAVSTTTLCALVFSTSCCLLTVWSLCWEEIGSCLFTSRFAMTSSLEQPLRGEFLLWWHNRYKCLRRCFLGTCNNGCIQRPDECTKKNKTTDNSNREIFEFCCSYAINEFSCSSDRPWAMVSDLPHVVC